MGGGKGNNPTGTIISFMGTNAPIGYLKCDGTVYNISDYPDLANHFNSDFGSKNYFGGNGSTTFAVPNLQGEFLRGTGTNVHTNQGSGSNVGVHQDGTLIPTTWGNSSVCSIKTNLIQNAENMFNSIGVRNLVNVGSTDNNASGVIARPTNTSVLYCIKY